MNRGPVDLQISDAHVLSHEVKFKRLCRARSVRGHGWDHQLAIVRLHYGHGGCALVMIRNKDDAPVQYFHGLLVAS